jgi:4-hydroxythreonine-4-phosphate dehydrogenase
MNDIRIGITIGDINGIGPEIILKTIGDKRILELFTPVIYGSSKVFNYYKKPFPDLEFNYIQVKDNQIVPNKINLVNIFPNEDLKVEPGQSYPIGGRFALEALNKATEHLKSGIIEAIVTGPVDKKQMSNNGFEFPGHTEFFEQNFEGKSLMIMTSELLKVALVTGHLAVNEVSKQVKHETIVKKCEILIQSLLKDFGVKKPRIAVLALNPHAGDNGMFGNEEQNEIIPAIKQLKERGHLVFGPYSADGFFASGSYKNFDAVLAMYHDQGLIPFKTIAGNEGVNFTAGLNIVRTSPDHGPAFDIAGKQCASEESIRNAVYLCIDVIKKRREFEEITKRPLKILSAEELNNLK